ncbi:8692_t:CDS:1, partial [Scutellospora calospora]
SETEMLSTKKSRIELESSDTSKHELEVQQQKIKLQERAVAIREKEIKLRKKEAEIEALELANKKLRNELDRRV